MTVHARANGFLVLILSAAFGLPAAGTPAQAPADKDKPTLELLHKSRAVEAFISAQLKFKETPDKGDSWISFDPLSDYAMGNVSSDRNTAKKVPVWNGRQFSIETAEDDGRSGKTNLTMSGTLAADLLTIERMTVKKSIVRSTGTATSVQWTFVNLPGGQVYRASYTNKRSINYQIMLPIDQCGTYLKDLTMTEKRSAHTVSFAGIPSLAEIETEYKGSGYLDSYKRAQLSVTFLID